MYCFQSDSGKMTTSLPPSRPIIEQVSVSCIVIINRFSPKPRFRHTKGPDKYGKDDVLQQGDCSVT